MDISLQSPKAAENLVRNPFPVVGPPIAAGTGVGSNSRLCLPIMVGSEVIGVMSVDLTVDEPEVLQQRCRFLEMAAAMIAEDVKSRRMVVVNGTLAYPRSGTVGPVGSREAAVHEYGLSALPQPPPGTADSGRAGSLKAQVAILERDLITRALKSCGGSVTATARQLGITPRMIRYKIKKLGIEYRQYLRKSRV